MNTHHPNPHGINPDEVVDFVDEDALLDPDDAAEEIQDNDDDAHMESDADEDASAEEIQLQNDSVAHFDAHKDSIFCIAQHPTHPHIIATGGGDDVGYIFDCTPAADVTQAASPRASLAPLAELTGHTDSLNAVSFTLPHGAYLLTAGLDGQLRAHRDTSSSLTGTSWTFHACAQEVDEINFLAPCPHPLHPDTIALGASDGSVWVYSVSASPTALDIVQVFSAHRGPCTAGAWTPDGALLATVSEDGSLHVWDVFGEAAAAALVQEGGQSVVSLTAQDERFKVEGGLFCVAVSPGGALVAVGGADGQIRVVGLPRLGAAEPVAAAGKRGAGVKTKPSGQKGTAAASAGQAGQILASLQTQSDSVETIAFAAPPLTLMAAGSVDGSIVLFDAAHRFAVRRHIKDAHEEEAVIKVEFVTDNGEAGNWVLTSCGNDGVLRRWDARGGTAAAAQGLLGEWRGHRGGGEGGGILGFVQRGYGGRWVVTAGDDHVALVFDTRASAQPV